MAQAAPIRDLSPHLGQGSFVQGNVRMQQPTARGPVDDATREKMDNDSGPAVSDSKLAGAWTFVRSTPSSGSELGASLSLIAV